MAVEDGVDFLGGGVVGHGHHVVAHLGDAHGAALGGHGEDGVAGVVLAGHGVRLQPAIQLDAGELADQHHGVGDGAIGAVGVLHAVEGDGGLVEVALPVDAGGLDELRVFGHALGRLQVGLEEGAHRAEVDVDDAVGLGQQARGLGRGLGAEKNGQRQQDYDGCDDKKRSAGAPVHS